MRRLFALAALLLAGCGSPAASTPEVASISAAPTRTAAAAAPVIRPDTTFAEQARMAQPWMRCLKENGVPMLTTAEGLLDINAGGNSKKSNGRIMAERDSKVVGACGKLKPVLAPELDEARNPYWADDDENYHLCLVEHGSKLVKKDGQWRPGPGWNEQGPDEARDLACQAEAYDGKRG